MEAGKERHQQKDAVQADVRLVPSLIQPSPAVHLPEIIPPLAARNIWHTEPWQ